MRQRRSLSEMDTSGDGFSIIFPRPAPGIEAARAIIDAVQPLELTTRVGMHAGDCHIADGKRTVQASAAPESDFLDRCVHTLRGVPGEWHLFAIAS